jgi:hypothetical protein
MEEVVIENRNQLEESIQNIPQVTIDKPYKSRTNIKDFALPLFFYCPETVFIFRKS